MAVAWSEILLANGYLARLDHVQSARLNNSVSALNGPWPPTTKPYTREDYESYQMNFLTCWWSHSDNVVRVTGLGSDRSEPIERLIRTVTLMLIVTAKTKDNVLVVGKARTVIHWKGQCADVFEAAVRHCTNLVSVSSRISRSWYSFDSRNIRIIQKLFCCQNLAINEHFVLKSKRT